MTDHRPWRGVLVATALPLRDDLSVDLDRYAEHCSWLVANGCDGVVPNGSLGSTRCSPRGARPGRRDGRRRRRRRARDARGRRLRLRRGAPLGGAGRRGRVPGGDAAAAQRLPRRPAVRRRPLRRGRPHRTARRRLQQPGRHQGRPGAGAARPAPRRGYVRAVKEFSGDVRRAYRIAELVPGLDLLVAPTTYSWSSPSPGRRGGSPGTPTPCPAPAWSCTGPPPPTTSPPRCRCTGSCTLLRWDSRVEFVQAIKLSMDLVGRRGGPCRPPRVPLDPEQEAAVRAATEKAVAAGLA